MKLKHSVDGLTITLVPTKRVRATLADNGSADFAITGAVFDNGDGEYAANVSIAAIEE